MSASIGKVTVRFIACPWALSRHVAQSGGRLSLSASLDTRNRARCGPEARAYFGDRAAEYWQDLRNFVALEGVFAYFCAKIG